MRKYIVFAAATLLFSSAAFAQGNIDDGHLLVKPTKNDRFATGEFIMGKAELFGYVADLKDSKKITAIVLRNADQATPQQKHVIMETAKAQHIDAFVDDRTKLIPLVDPLAPPAQAPAATH